MGCFFCFLQVIDGFIDFVDGLAEFFAGQAVIAAEALLEFVQPHILPTRGRR